MSLIRFAICSICLLLAPLGGCFAAAQDMEHSAAGAESQGQSLNMMGENVDFFCSGTVEMLPSDVENQMKYVKGFGDVHIVSEKLDLRCHDFTFDGEKGEMTALAWPDRQVQIVQLGTTAFTDKMYYLTENKRTELLGNSMVRQVGAENTAEVYGDLIVLTENPDGTSRINVQRNPLMNYFPNPGAEDAVTSVPLEGADVDSNAALAGVSSGLGENFRLVADPKNGVFDIQTDGAGGLQDFRASRHVILKSDKLDLDCDQLQFKDNGKSIVALGGPVLIRQGQVFADCHRFERNIEANVSILTGKPAPRIHVSENNQNVIQTAPKIILTENQEGKTVYLLGQEQFQREKTDELPEVVIRTNSSPEVVRGNEYKSIKLVPGLPPEAEHETTPD